jgi:xylulokinase
VDGASPENFLRAAVDGVAAGIAYCVEALRRLGVFAPVVTLVGGGSAHPTWQQAIADATGLPVAVRAGGEHCARGAATQIAAIIRGETVADLAGRWRPEVVAEVKPREDLRDAFSLSRREQLIEEIGDGS